MLISTSLSILQGFGVLAHEFAAGFLSITPFAERAIGLTETEPIDSTKGDRVHCLGFVPEPFKSGFPTFSGGREIESCNVEFQCDANRFALNLIA
jgi:hypothetical protein